MQSGMRLVPALAIALLAGVVRALQLYAPQVLVSGGVDALQLQVVLPFLGVLSIALSPFGVVVAGYFWGVGNNVPDQWFRFGGATVLAAVGGYLVTALGMLGFLVGSGSVEFVDLAGPVTYAVIPALGLVGVGLVALAGAGIVEFRRPQG